MEVVLKEGLLVQKVVDELVILDPQSGDYFTLNNMGALMLEKLQAGLSTAEIAEQISADYTVDCAQVTQDLTDLLAQLALVDLAHKR